MKNVNPALWRELALTDLATGSSTFGHMIAQSSSQFSVTISLGPADDDSAADSSLVNATLRLVGFPTGFRVSVTCLVDTSRSCRSTAQQPGFTFSSLHGWPRFLTRSGVGHP